MRTFKEKNEHLISKKRIINEKLDLIGNKFHIGFTFKRDGTKILYKVESESGKLVGNLAKYLTFSEMNEYLNGFYVALKWQD